MSARNDQNRGGNGEGGMEIPLGQRRRVVGLVSYLIFFAAVAGVLILLFVRFTGSTVLAIALVVGMVAYMAVIGHLAAKK
jgi:hypothetical protein